jgi:hypothetical protein
MSKSTGCLAFASKPSEPLGVATNFGRQNLYRYAIAEQDVAGEINCPHATLAQQRFDLVLAVEDGVHQGRGIIFQNFAVNWTETHAFIEFGLADRTMLHTDLIEKRYIRIVVICG